MKRKIDSYMIGVLLLASACKETGRLDRIDGSSQPPAQVSDITVKNIPGGAVLKYKVPEDENLLYVKAVYETQPGAPRETKSSFYKDSLVVEGYGSSGTYPVEIYSVGKNERSSEPIRLEISPLSPPVERVFPTLQLDETFGGVRIGFTNTDEANLAISLMIDSVGNGRWNLLQTFYTKSPKGTFSYTGLPASQAKFGVYIKDRWANESDTLVKEITPLFEEAIPKPYGTFNLPSDTYLPIEDRPSYSLPHAWDGITSNVNDDIFASKPNSPMPQTFTANLQCTAVISRIRVHQRKGYEYTGANVRKFQLYGANSVSPGDDLFGGDWVLLGEFESFKPSGAGPVTEDDRNYANVQGENFELVQTDLVPNPWVPVKFIRFRAMETFNGPSTMGAITIAEISLFGQIQE